MSHFSKLLMVFLFISPSFQLFAQNVDSISYDTAVIFNQIQESPFINEQAKELDLAMELQIYGFVALVFIFITILNGTVLTILLLLFVYAFTAFKILSPSTLIGLNKLTFSKGFKTFFITSTTIGSCAWGAFGLWAYNKITHWWSVSTSITFGSIIGILSGILLGYLLFFIIQKLTTLMTKKYIKERDE